MEYIVKYLHCKYQAFYLFFYYFHFSRCFDEHQRSPLHFAAAMGYSEVAEILLKHGADPNQKVGHLRMELILIRR